tara:strand:- start:7614 stop:8372 length:759 start_codon:yes stop_codon:yes gene_type:complete
VKIVKILIISISLSFFGNLTADDHIDISAMEGLQCNIRDGKDMDDVMKVISEWNEYGDENFSEPYSAWIFTPVYRTNSDFDFDFMFLGFTETMQAMGKVQDDWQVGGSRIDEKWSRVTDCLGQSININVEVRSPKYSWEEGGTTYASIRSCTFKDDKSTSDLAGNDKIWNKYLDEYGFEGGVWRWWPETGSATTFTHDYWNVASFRSVEEYGAGRDARLKAMMADTRPEEIHNCDTPRLYKATNIRLVQAEG